MIVLQIISVIALLAAFYFIGKGIGFKTAVNLISNELERIQKNNNANEFVNVLDEIFDEVEDEGK